MKTNEDPKSRPPRTDAGELSSPSLLKLNGARNRRLALLPLEYVEPRQVRWLVRGLIPLRTLTLVAGIGGVGKSSWLASVAARVSRGDAERKPADVLLVSFEDAAAEVLRPRVEAADGDLARVHSVAVDAFGIDAVQLPADIDELERLVAQVEARLIVIDPIVAAIDRSIDANQDQDVRHVLFGLVALAERSSCAVVCVAHLNKNPSREAYLRVANSTAFWNASRSVVLVAEDPDDPETGRLIGQRKSNYSRLRPVERWRLEEVVLAQTLDPDTGEPIQTARMIFVETADEIDAADLLAPRPDGDQRRGEADALRFLRSMLTDGDWHDSAGLSKQAASVGIKKRTLQRAAHDLGVEHKRSGEYPSVTHWRLPVAPTSTRARDATGATGGTRLVNEIPIRSDSSRDTPSSVGAAGATDAVDAVVNGEAVR
jgi:AAA domain